MKRKLIIFLYFIILLFSLSGCKNASINDSIYIGSIGLDYKDSEYIGYFYLPSSVTVGALDSSHNSKGFVGEVKSESLLEVFDKMKNENNVVVNYKHISSLVLSESVVTETNLIKLIEYINYSNLFDINFYIFGTNEDIKDIYSLENPNNESIIVSMLLDPNNEIYNYLGAKPIHYLSFCNEYLSDRTVSIPLLDKSSIWEIKDKKANGYYIKGVMMFNKEEVIISDRLEFCFFKDNKVVLISKENLDSYIYDYKIKYSFKDKIFIDIRYRYNIFVGSSDMIEEHIKENITFIINEYEDKIDFLSIKYLNKLTGNNTNIKDIVFNISSR